MTEYRSLLMNQYKSAAGIRYTDPISESFDSEFEAWLNEYVKTGNFYLNTLSKMGLLDNLSNSTAEIGKGDYDTLTVGMGTTLISPYADCKLDNNKVFTTDFGVFDGIPLHLGNHGFDPVRNVDTFMTQNPYDLMSLINWHQLYNYGNHDFIIGMYGKIYDRDKKVKLERMKETQKRIKVEFDIMHFVDKDDYCAVLSANHDLVKKY